ncbi:MAG: choice-of-anchor L domain-containing protein [Pseudomonadota bacterium]
MRVSTLTGVALILLPATASAVTSTTATSDAAALAQSLLGANTDVTINSATLTGDAGVAAGFFSGGLTSIGLAEGVILSTGDVADAPGPNTVDNVQTDLLGDDIITLAIEFTTQTGDLFFNYVFASDEYNEFANSTFNDDFQFILNGTTNIALIPGTTTPVSINTVNGGNPLGTSPVNEQFFNNNDLDDGGPFFNVEYDGFTDVFTAAATGLGIGSTNLIQLVVEDIGDDIFDSAVFIQGGSFGGTEPPAPPPIPLPAGLPLMLTALAGLALVRRQAAKPTA